MTWTWEKEEAARKARHEATLAAAVERATEKLTVLEYNALALHIKAQVLADEEAKHRQSVDFP